MVTKSRGGRIRFILIESIIRKTPGLKRYKVNMYRLFYFNELKSRWGVRYFYSLAILGFSPVTEILNLRRFTNDRYQIV